MSEKAGFKTQHSKTKIKESDPITSWQIEGEKVQAVTDFIFLGSKNHCGWSLQPWNQRRLLLGRKAFTIVDSILKSRDIALPTKVCTDKAMFFSSSHIWM